MKHYLQITADMADAGLDKLTAWMAREGMQA